MPRFGRNHFPRRFGGGRRRIEYELQAQLDALAPAFDVRQESLIYAEAYAHALGVSMIWAVNERALNQAFPMRMQEMLPVWEKILKIRVSDDLLERRRAVAARFTVLGGNTTARMYDAVFGLIGDRLVDLSGPSEEWAYYPAIMPGPPGFEWCSNRSIYYVSVRKDGLDTNAYLRMISQIADLMESVLRVDMSYMIGVDEGGFRAGIGSTGVTFV